jgi:hypothetical protein
LSSKELLELIPDQSIVLAYIQATEFERRRRLADGVLASEIYFDGWLSEPTLCVDLARKCYLACWNTLRPHWPLYEELADRLPEIIASGRQTIRL